MELSFFVLGALLGSAAAALAFSLSELAERFYQRLKHRRKYL